jgi:hypothetical protein
MSQYEIVVLLYWSFGILASLNVFFLFRRRLYREVPWFVTYMLAVVANQVIDDYLLLYVRPPYFYYGAWAFQGVMVVLGLLFNIEAIRNALVDYPTVRRWGTNAIVVVALALTVVALCMLPYGSENANKYMKVTQIAMRSARMIQLGVIVAFFSFTSYLALGWRHYQVGILLGYGLYVATSLAGSAYVAQMGPSVGWRMTLLDSYAFLCTLILWLVYIVRTKPAVPRELPLSASTDLDGWNEALTDLIKK